MSFRKIIFWVHLVAGLISGLAIGVMCFTGTVLAFEKEIVAWAERDARLVDLPSPSAKPLPLAELQARLRAAQPEARPMNLVLQNNPRAAVAFSAGRTAGFYVDPYTGEVRQPKSRAVAEFMQRMTSWHRYLGFSGQESRPRGKLVNGICNLAFCALAITGLYLWAPRVWSWRTLKPGLWFRRTSSAKARDFSWHNVIGFWSAPILIVLTLTAIPISFPWGGRVINRLTGTPNPAPNAAPAPRASGGGGPGAAPTQQVSPPSPGAVTLDLEAQLARVRTEIPSWETITLRVSENGGVARSGSGSAPAATFTVRASDTWPRTANTTLTLNPFTGEVLRRIGYADQNGAQRVRAWTRFLHTGEALGNIGQLLAGLACLGGCVLVYTGFALAWRRFFGRPTLPDSSAASRD